jgi:putative toxin-antitoxin system antitoxin component (TIGR02293 family)
MAEQVFGERERALRWLRAPKRRLGGRSPLDATASDVGARMVEEMLHQVDHGLVA